MNTTDLVPMKWTCNAARESCGVHNLVRYCGDEIVVIAKRDRYQSEIVYYGAMICAVCRSERHAVGMCCVCLLILFVLRTLFSLFALEQSH